MNAPTIILLIAVSAASMAGANAATVRMGDERAGLLHGSQLGTTAESGMCGRLISGGGLYYAGSSEDPLPLKWTSGASLVYTDPASSYMSETWSGSDSSTATAWVGSLPGDSGRYLKLESAPLSPPPKEDIISGTLHLDLSIPEPGFLLLGGASAIGMLLKRGKRG